MQIGSLDGVLAGRGAHVPWIDLYKRCADLGLSGLELGVAANYAETQLWNGEGRAVLSKAAADNGVVTPSICIHSYWNYSFANDNEAIRKQAEEIARGAAIAAKEMGAINILIPLTGPQEGAVAVSRERWIAGIKAVAPAAEEAGVCFCLENVGREYGNAPEDIAAIVDAIASPAVGVYYDPGNAVHAGLDPIKGIEVLGSRIKHAHVKEVGGTYLGEGTVPWSDIIPAFRAIGYDGWLIFETDGTDDPMEAGRRNLEYLQKLI